MLQTKNGLKLDPSKAKEIAAGGEGRILEHPTHKSKVVKLYHTPRDAGYAKHLEELATLDDRYFIRPEEVYFDSKGRVAAFVMPYVNLNDYFLFNNLFNKGFCTTHGIDMGFKLRVLDQLKQSVEDLHAHSIVVGDLNQYNLFVSKKGELLFADVDSFQTPSHPHSGVLLDEIRDWTTLGITPQTDAWAYDILAFWATTHCHPFKWVVPGNKETLEQRVRAKKSILSPLPGVKLPALYQPPDGTVETQFKEVFHGGRRYMVDFAGTPIPVNVQVRQNLTSQALDIHEVARDVLRVLNNRMNLTYQQRNGDWTFLDTGISKLVRPLSTHQGDWVFPGHPHPVVFHQNTLSLGSQQVDFPEPELYYEAGGLAVFDYAMNAQYNLALNHQSYGLDMTRTAVFAKSIVLRDSPIQNFGAKKYLNLPNGNKYALVEVPQGTQNAVHDDSHVAVEVKQKARVDFYLFSVGLPGQEIALEYLPYFCVKNNTIFIPDNGEIGVYRHGVQLARLDCPVATRSSKLYGTQSGILLLENNILYLLNTK